MVNSIIILDINLLETGNIIYLMEKIANNFIKIEAIIKANLSMDSNQEKVYISGQMERLILASLKMV